MEQLEPNNHKVTAYYLPDEEGKPTDVFLYQNDRYIDKVRPMETYNRVMAERTEEDERIKTEQNKIVSHFGKWLRDNAISPVGVMAVQGEEDEDMEALALPSAEPTGTVAGCLPDDDGGCLTDDAGAAMSWKRNALDNY